LCHTVISKRKRPAKPFKKDGSLSATGEKWFALLRERHLPEDYLGVVEVVTGYKEPHAVLLIFSETQTNSEGKTYKINTLINYSHFVLSLYEK